PGSQDTYSLRMALKPKGSPSATTDPDVANDMAAGMVIALEERRRNKALGITPNGVATTFKAAVAEHLLEKALEDVTDGWIAESEHMLSRAIDFFGPDRDVASFEPADVREWMKHLGTVDSGRGDRKLSGGTIRHHINTLSNFFGTAIEKGWIAHNPVANLKRGTKPKAKRQEAAWFEPPEASLILAAAFRYKSKKAHMAIPFAGPLVATFLLTGGRKSEILGLRAEDINFDRNLIHIRENASRRLKTGHATRTVPLWPQLREILQRHVFEDGHVSGLLFPSPAGTGMINDLEKMLDGIADFIGWEKGSIRTKAFRHSYCSARLQTFERVKVGEDEDGEPILEAIPVSPFTVAKEMGHGGDSLVKRIYGHLGTVRHRSEAVEFRVEQHKEALKDKLEALRSE
ncbi:MAG: tyrosine-type recombinase/integrase, partial [Longimicrobiales bacterium]